MLPSQPGTVRLVTVLKIGQEPAAENWCSSINLNEAVWASIYQCPFQLDFVVSALFTTVLYSCCSWCVEGWCYHTLSLSVLLVHFLVVESYWPLVCGEARGHGRELCLFRVFLLTVWELDWRWNLELVTLDVVTEYLSIPYVTLPLVFFPVESVGISDELKTKLKDVLIQEQQFTLGRMLGKGKNQNWTRPFIESPACVTFTVE